VRRPVRLSGRTTAGHKSFLPQPVASNNAASNSAGSNANPLHHRATAAARARRQARKTTSVAVRSICLVRAHAIPQRAWVAGGGPRLRRCHRTPREPRVGCRSGVCPQPIAHSHRFTQRAGPFAVDLAVGFASRLGFRCHPDRGASSAPTRDLSSVCAWARRRSFVAEIAPLDDGQLRFG
jgi:hypothetical protein